MEKNTGMLIAVIISFYVATQSFLTLSNFIIFFSYLGGPFKMWIKNVKNMWKFG